MNKRFSSIFIISCTLILIAFLVVFAVRLPASVYADNVSSNNLSSGAKIATPTNSQGSVDGSDFDSDTDNDTDDVSDDDPASSDDSAAGDSDNGVKDRDSFTIRYYSGAPSDSSGSDSSVSDDSSDNGSDVSGSSFLGEVLVDAGNLDSYGGYTLIVPVDKCAFAEGTTFGGWVDENGNSLYSYVYGGNYYITVYPSASCSIYCRSAAEDYFIEDTVHVFTSEKVSLEEGEE
ncbi:MAG: hypothetical protein Q4D40_04290 [Eubacteriales bacterium]|nr:hypothetical protein [Eubacteriales bacterium]